MTPPLTRRELLCRSGMGLGALAFAGLLGDAGLLSAAPAGAEINPLAPKAPPFPARARHVINLFMNGGPSHVDTSHP